MAMLRSIRSFVVLSGMLVSGTALAQDPTNTTCDHAMVICSPTTIANYFLWGVQPECLWYRLCQTPSVPFTATVSEGTGYIWSEAACDTREEDCDIGSYLKELGSSYTPSTPGDLLISVHPTYSSPDARFILQIDGLEPDTTCCKRHPYVPKFDDCEHCLGSLSPTPDSTYSIDAWVSREKLSIEALQVEGPFVQVEFPGSASAPETWTTNTSLVQTPVIDGWQLIHGEFTMPSDATGFKVVLGSTLGAGLFDDVRIQPKNAGMVSYVYDPITLRLVAELDDRHFATKYEYDGEGKLVRVKKETERGVMTIQETRYNSAKSTTP